jgi:hypothetical protein
MTMTQAKGALTKVVIDFETAFGADPSSVDGIVVPFNYPFDLGGSRPLKEANNTNRGRRDAGAPFYGQFDVKGGCTIPVDQVGIGYWLRALLGAPTTGTPHADTLDNAAAVDKVGDFVGLPISGHAFVAGETVVIDGTTHYDGTFVIYSKTTNEIVIPSLYVAETFAGTETVTSGTYTHVFKPAAAVESMVVEKQFTNISQYLKNNGVKLNKFDMDFGGDGELVAKLDFVGADETPSGTPYDASPTTLTFSRFHNMQASIKEGGATVATVQSGKFTISNDLDTGGYVIDGSGGKRCDVAEGEALVSGSLKLMFESLAFLNKGLNGTESSLEIKFTSGLYSLTFLFEEVQYEYKGVSILKGGIWVEPTFQAFYEDGAGAAVTTVTLVNNYASYA